MGLLLGKNLLVSYTKDNKDYVIGYATSCELDLGVDTTETSSTSWKQMNETSGDSWKTYTIAKKNWTVSSDHMIDAGMAEFTNIFDLFVSGEEVTIKFGEVKYSSSTTENKTSTFTSYYKGKAIITSLKASGSTDGEATYSITFTGTGAIESAIMS
jgi:predicted secreted protein